MHTVLFYIEKTRSIRKSSKLFVSYVSYDKVTTSTIARWLKFVLQEAGIDTSVFKAHSFTGAAASAAFSSGCTLKSILQTGDWSSDKNFYNFYYRDVVNSELTEFVKSMFS